MIKIATNLRASACDIFCKKWYWLATCIVGCLLLSVSGCTRTSLPAYSANYHKSAGAIYPGKPEKRSSDEIVAAGHFFHTGTRVILWMDKNGYDAYRQARWFTKRPNKASEYKPPNKNSLFYSPNHYNIRAVNKWSMRQLYELRRGRWTLAQLQDTVNKIVLHYDACGTSERCFQVLQQRGLSTQFMIDLDGTVYQTLDLKERAWTAGIANDHSINIEIANIGAYPVGSAGELKKWYKQKNGQTSITIPQGFGKELYPQKAQHPMRPKPIIGKINGHLLEQYDYTPAQYQALIKLTIALHRIFPKIKIAIPRNKQGGALMSHPLTNKQLKAFHGIIGHQHVTERKEDPGPAFQWNWFIKQVKQRIDNG